MTKPPDVTPLRLASTRPDKLRSASKRRAAITAPGTDIGEPPKHLSAAAAEVWRSTVASAPPGLLQAADGPVLGVYCVAVATLQAASATLDREGLTSTGRNGDVVRHPCVMVANAASTAMLAAAAQLGLSPRARARLGISTDPTPPASDPYDI